MRNYFAVLFALLAFHLLSAGPTHSEGGSIVKNCSVDVSDLKSKEEVDLASQKCRAAFAMNIAMERLNSDVTRRREIERAFSFQHTATVLSFGLFSLIALIGLIFCYVEFRRGDDATTTIKLGSSQIEISSRIMGLLILFISLGFGYFFFEKAYRINVVSLNAADAAVSSDGATVTKKSSSEK